MSLDRCLALLVLSLAAWLSGCMPASTEPASVEPTSASPEDSATQDPPPTTPVATVVEHGFITTRDGTRLRYTVQRPASGAPAPVILNYEGYAAGSTEGDNFVAFVEPDLIQRGFAVVGVQVRGTGCSYGEWRPADHHMGEDGYDAVEWIAAQPWSDGRVGMIGSSFGGVTQFYVAGQRPPHLRAIEPASVAGDLYRDVWYPGGILNASFAAYWPYDQKAAYFNDEGPKSDPDPECAALYAQHELANANSDDFITLLLVDHPFFDDDGLYVERSPYPNFPRIEIPAFVFGAWQDEELGSRVFDTLDLFPRPERLWINFGNGNHGRELDSTVYRDLMVQFLDRFVGDVDNGFEQRVAHLTLAMEVVSAPQPTVSPYSKVEGTNVPTWNVARRSLAALKPRPREFHLHSGGLLAADPDVAGAAGDAYAYPAPSSDTFTGPTFFPVDHTGHSISQVSWKTPVPPGGAVAYTTPPLDDDLVVAGPGSLDVWMTSTASDVDVQATVTEVRPDGQELYVQRGWLRASHRKLDPEQSTELRPYQTHARADAAPLTAGEPTLLRVEIFPFAQTFRKGSRIRVWIDAPTSGTGAWTFEFTATPAVNTVLHDAAHPSRLVLGELKGEVAQAPMPACDTLRNQPCRMDPLLK